MNSILFISFPFFVYAELTEDPSHPHHADRITARPNSHSAAEIAEADHFHGA
jgi:hypothetical protein